MKNFPFRPFTEIFMVERHIQHGKAFGELKLLHRWLTASLEAMLTTNNLKKRPNVVVDWCCMSKQLRESTNHFLLIDCPFVF